MLLSYEGSCVFSPPLRSICRNWQWRTRKITAAGKCRIWKWWTESQDQKIADVLQYMLSSHPLTSNTGITATYRHVPVPLAECIAMNNVTDAISPILWYLPVGERADKNPTSGRWAPHPAYTGLWYDHGI